MRLLLLQILLLAAAPVAGQARQTALFGAAERISTPITQQDAPVSNTRMVLGGLAGGAVGLVAGGLLGAVIGNDDDSEEGWVDALQGAVIGGTIGESAGIALGVHLANRRRGSLPLELVASTAIGVIGLLVLYENQSPPIAPILLAATPAAQLASVIAIERR